MIRYYVEVAASSLVAVLAGAAFVQALSFDGASMYLPSAASGLATAMAVLWLARSLTPRGRGRILAGVESASPPEQEAMHSLSGKVRAVRTAAILALTAVYVGLIKAVGLVTVTFAFIAIGSRLLGASWRTALIAALCFAVVVYVVFGLLLQLPLPPEALLSAIKGGK